MCIYIYTYIPVYIYIYLYIYIYIYILDIQICKVPILLCALFSLSQSHTLRIWVTIQTPPLRPSWISQLGLNGKCLWKMGPFSLTLACRKMKFLSSRAHLSRTVRSVLNFLACTYCPKLLRSLSTYLGSPFRGWNLVSRNPYMRLSNVVLILLRISLQS